MSDRAEHRMLMVTTVHQTLTAFLLPFAQHLRASGWRVDAATGAAPETAALAPHFDAVHPVDWSRSVGALGNVRGLAQLRRVLRRGDYDVVHVHTPIAALLTRFAVASLRRRPAVVYTAHGFHFYAGGSPRRNLVYRTAERLGGRWTDRLVVINTEDRDAAVAHRIVPPERLRLFPGIGVNLDHYAPTPEMHAAARELRATLGIDADAVVYSMIAEFQPRKNHRAAVEAFGRLPAELRADAFLLLAGRGPLEDEVRGLADRLGVGDQVLLLGNVLDVRPLVLTSAATVLPSRQEGLSRAVMESLAIGVPVVGGRTRGIRDLVDPDLGRLVAPDDVDGLARALVEVLDLPSHGQLRDRSLDRMQQYSIDHVVALHDELYAEVLADRARPVRT